ncbi:unnamed protein product [Protopolystoma xenopodis]|uniref:fumarate hydratase n=1 Tax=Protopolystoma xenopodis TaxID=117903 RepID=A0A448X6X0_9PLAT|nr:unnamed protein product [Protopolystoma xenopodis]
MGSIEVDFDRYYGAQTERSKRNFNIMYPHDKMPVEVIYALAMIKEAACSVNANRQLISMEIALAIKKACHEIYIGKFDDEFPLVIWQTGSGTHTNMNVNEVIANRASEIIGGRRGEKSIVHPNDHVNCSQSSNDSFPTAMHIAIAKSLTLYLLPSLKHLISSFNRKINEFGHIIKIGRTHMQDAVPITFGQEFSGYVSHIEFCVQSIQRILPVICELAIGGTAVGTGLNSPSGFDQDMCAELNKLFMKCLLVNIV